jgi:hypothetical protein
MSTRTRQQTLIRCWDLELQQLTQSTGSGLMKSRAQGSLQRFQIRAAGVPAFREDAAQQ